MNERLKQLARRAEQELNADGSVTILDDSLLTREGERGIEGDYLEALLAESVSEALRLARERAGLSGAELARQRRLSPGRISQMERSAQNPGVQALAEHVDLLGYDARVVLTPRKGGPSIEVALTPGSAGEAP